LNSKDSSRYHDDFLCIFTFTWEISDYSSFQILLQGSALMVSKPINKRGVRLICFWFATGCALCQKTPPASPAKEPSVEFPAAVTLVGPISTVDFEKKCGFINCPLENLYFNYTLTINRKRATTEGGPKVYIIELANLEPRIISQ